MPRAADAPRDHWLRDFPPPPRATVLPCYVLPILIAASLVPYSRLTVHGSTGSPRTERMYPLVLSLSKDMQQSCPCIHKSAGHHTLSFIQPIDKSLFVQLL